MNRVSMEVLIAIDELNARYAEALDSHDMPAWLATFEEQPGASYICTTADSFEAGHRVALILDDCYARLQDRVTFVTKIWVGTYQDYRTRHLVQRTWWQALSSDEYELRSNFTIAFTHSDVKLTETFIAGVYRDRVRVTSSGASLISRTAITDGAMLPRYVTYPL